jgi:hypothetical protein
MKPESPSPRKSGGGRKNKSLGGPTYLPMEWMDPMSWRLPSGQALAEFALQSGFLAPLIMRGPKVKRTWQAEPRGLTAKKAEEAPERTATFRHTQ